MTVWYSFFSLFFTLFSSFIVWQDALSCSCCHSEILHAKHIVINEMLVFIFLLSIHLISRLLEVHVCLVLETFTNLTGICSVSPVLRFDSHFNSTDHWLWLMILVNYEFMFIVLILKSTLNYLIVDAPYQEVFPPCQFLQ